MKGRPRKPVAVLKMSGTYRADRHEERAEAPPADGWPVKPDYLNGAAGDYWDSVVPELVRLGVTGAVDSMVLVAACEAWAAYRVAADAMLKLPTRENRQQFTALLDSYVRVAARVGLNPMDRSKIQVPAKPTGPQGVAEFARKRV